VGPIRVGPDVSGGSVVRRSEAGDTALDADPGSWRQIGWASRRFLINSRPYLEIGRADSFWLSILITTCMNSFEALLAAEFKPQMNSV